MKNKEFTDNDIKLHKSFKKLAFGKMSPFDQKTMNSLNKSVLSQQEHMKQHNPWLNTSGTKSNKKANSQFVSPCHKVISPSPLTRIEFGKSQKCKQHQPDKQREHDSGDYFRRQDAVQFGV
jgi:hypothetical protein